MQRIFFLFFPTDAIEREGERKDEVFAKSEMCRWLKLHFRVDLEKCCKMPLCAQKSASIEPLFWYFDAHCDFDILTIFWYFSSPPQQNASTNILTWKSAPRPTPRTTPCVRTNREKLLISRARVPRFRSFSDFFAIHFWQWQEKWMNERDSAFSTFLYHPKRTMS